MLIGLGGGAASSRRQRQLERRPRFRLRAARQCRRSSAARRKSSITAGRWATTIPIAADPRRGRRRSVERGAGGRGAQPARRAHRPARRSERRARHVAAGALVQRGAGALRAGHRGRRALEQFGAIAERERCPFAVIGEIDGSGRLVVRDPLFRDDAGRHAARGAARQAAADDGATCVSVDAAAPALRQRRGSSCARRPTACCGCRPWPTRPSSSPSAIAPWAA